jgi:2-polyprenyl-3-methyl-5-hydroxy-6-metoxy-1,4-benzoquinol methylase
VTDAAGLTDRLRQYYTRYYHEVLGIPDWTTLVTLREDEARQERGRLDRLRHLVGDASLSGRVLNVGCGTGGFNVVAAERGAWVVGADEDTDAIAICALRQRANGGRYAQAAAERLPFRDAVFDLVHCFSVIEHVASVEASIREMVRVTRPGGAIYVHTPNAWSLYEGHYKLFWMPFLPAALGRLYLRLRGRPTAYLASLRRLTPGRLRRAFAAAGVTALTMHRETSRPRESAGPLRALAAIYYRVTGMPAFIEMVARKP